MSAIVELYGNHVDDPNVNWELVVSEQIDKYTTKKSIKVRKSEPGQTIGTVVIKVGRDPRNLIVDPTRFLEKGKVFLDCIHLITNHEPGNDLHLVPEVQIPGGNVDFFLVSVKKGKVQDFVGIELQALDTTGSLWAERQLLLQKLGLDKSGAQITRANFGINWKMTAKTTLVQLHHKVRTFEHLNKHLVLVAQDHLINYMKRDFDFSEFHEPVRLGDPMHIHSYTYNVKGYQTSIDLTERMSSDSLGLATSLGLKAEAKIELKVIVEKLQSKISDSTLFNPIAG